MILKAPKLGAFIGFGCTEGAAETYEIQSLFFQNTFRRI